MKPTKTAKRLQTRDKTRSRMTQARLKRGKAYRDTPAKLTPAQYVRLINYLY